MKLVLSFLHPSRPAREEGPFQSVSLDADTLRDVASEKVIARQREHQWELDGERYFRVDATPVRIHFERTQPYPRAPVHSRTFGPYRRFSAVDGVAYTDDRVFAFVDTKAGAWFCYDDARHWSIMVISDAGAASRQDLWAALAGLAPCLPGVIGLWQDAKLAYLGRARSIPERLASLAQDFDARLVTRVIWETHPRPATREAALLAKYSTHNARRLAKAS